jgi:hypothetical protein
MAQLLLDDPGEGVRGEAISGPTARQNCYGGLAETIASAPLLSIMPFNVTPAQKTSCSIPLPLQETAPRPSKAKPASTGGPKLSMRSNQPEAVSDQTTPIIGLNTPDRYRPNREDSLLQPIHPQTPNEICHRQSTACRVSDIPPPSCAP